jgi:hypothetical protein
LFFIAVLVILPSSQNLTLEDHRIVPIHSPEGIARIERLLDQYAMGTYHARGLRDLQTHFLTSQYCASLLRATEKIRATVVQERQTLGCSQTL